jgi:glycogen debranching enzyme
MTWTPEKNLSQELPNGFQLLDGERLLGIEQPSRRYFLQPPSSLEQILRLTRARQESEIGKHGPSIAALAMESISLIDDGKPPEHLRLYEVVFGRDSLRMAIDLISSYPELARTTVLELAKLQGLSENTTREEEPGRIVHEVRSPDDKIAIKLTEERGWGWPYYGSVDATPEFIRTLAAYCHKSEENHAFLSEEYVDLAGDTQTISHSLELALDWILQRLDSNPEGLLEFKSPLPLGIENQVWKDSWDAYHHADGSLANHNQGIASIEVQTTTYDALLDAAELMENALDQQSRGNDLRLKASRLKEAILEHFWTKDKGGYFVLGTDRNNDGSLRQMKIRTSNMGHVLNSRLLSGDDAEIVRRREAVMNHMLSPEMQNASGIRTLASDEVRFRPGSYHNGSVWLWDTHHIAKGMRRHGYVKEARELDQKILNVPKVTFMFPEYVRGDDSPEPSTNQYIISVYDEINHRENLVEQPPQEVQGWTTAAILATTNRINRERIENLIDSAQQVN